MFVKRMFCVLALGALLVATAVPASAEMLDEVADLDLNNVVKAVHWGNSDGAGGVGTGLGIITTNQTIGATTFLVSGGHNITANGVTTAGMGYSGEHDGWDGFRPDIGATADDEALEDILASTVWAAIDDSTITIPMPDGFYKLQLLFYDPWLSARPVDIVVEGETIATQYDQAIDQGGTADAGSLLAHEFTLTDGQVDILFTNGTDQGYHLSGLILTIPEPSTFVLAVFGLIGLAFYRLRRRNP